MPFRKTTEFLSQKPITLTHTGEHRVVRRKWWAVFLLIVGGVALAGRLPVPLWIPYVLLFFGHGGMLHSFWEKRDMSMTMVNSVWLLIDLVGVVRWSHQ